MVQAVQAPCPGCRRVLRIPADWSNQVLRCKHCGLIVQAQTNGAPLSFTAVPNGASTPAAPTLPTPSRAATAGTQPEPSGAFAFDTEGQAGPGTRSRRRSSGGVGLTAAVVSVCVLAFVGTLGWLFWPALQAQLNEARSPFEVSADGTHSDNATTTTRLTTPPPKSGVSPAEVPLDTPFPRRALVVGVSNYVYANPVSYLVGQGGAAHQPLERIGAFLRIHPDQMVELSDAANGGRAVPPLKPVIEQSVRDFLAGCRAQDRILVAFCGHAVVLDDEPFLVPLEGELTVKETLLPLSWLLEQVAQCKARQKVLLLDVCRFDPGRGLERPASGPMHEKFDAALQNPPEGVQIWTACTAGQQSLEGEKGSEFFQSLEKVLGPLMSKRLQKPDEPLPMEALVPLVKDEIEMSSKQAPRLTGKLPESGTAYDPAEKLPAKLVAKLPAVEGSKTARVEVQRILDELDLPPVKPPRAQTLPLRLEALVPFALEALEPYKADYKDLKEIREQPEKYPLRVAVLEAADALRKHAGVSLPDYIPASGPASDVAKKAILEQQREPALIFLDLKTRVETLRELAEKKDEEPKRWQAHYDYVLSQMLARMAHVHEYNLMQGKIRKDDLPALEKFHVGHRLASRERLQSDQEIRSLASESKKLLQQIVKKYPGTPWEILAKRERFTALGLEWQPARQ